MHRSICWLGLAWILTSFSAVQSDSLSSLPDPSYSQLSPNALSGSITGTIDRIVYPTLGFPSIVAHGDTITVLYRLRQMTSPGFDVRLRRTLGPVRNEQALVVRQATHDPSWGGYRIQVTVPSTVAPDMYDLVVRSAGGDDSQPNTVRVVTSIPKRFRFLQLADPQHTDPRGIFKPAPLNNGTDDPVAIMARELEEIRFLDPLFTVVCGDLVFGLDYGTEYSFSQSFWAQAGFPAFMVPGNHDGYATTQNYRYQWLQAFPRDGLEHWRRNFGPLYYSFDIGKYHFVGINSYDGTPARRDSIHIVVRNHGGYLSRTQLNWLKRDLATASASGRTSILFMHHNPRGSTGRTTGPYIADRPFTVQSLIKDLEQYAKTGDFNDLLDQDWNDEKSAKELLWLAGTNRVSHVLLGHVHHDRVATQGKIQFVETTTLSSSSSHGYWGYRLFEVDENGVRRVDYQGANRQSIPAGNLFFRTTGNNGSDRESTISIENGLSLSLSGLLRISMPWSAQGYQIQGATLQRTEKVGDEAIVTLQATAPAGQGIYSPSHHRIVVKSLATAPVTGPGCAKGASVLTGKPGTWAIVSVLLWFVVTPFLVWFGGRRLAARRMRTRNATPGKTHGHSSTITTTRTGASTPGVVTAAFHDGVERRASDRRQGDRRVGFDRRRPVGEGTVTYTGPERRAAHSRRSVDRRQGDRRTLPVGSR